MRLSEAELGTLGPMGWKGLRVMIGCTECDADLPLEVSYARKMQYVTYHTSISSNGFL
jgi:hypothetical protein